MFGMLESLVKAAAAVVTVPVAVVADAVEDFVDNIKNATDPRK